MNTTFQSEEIMKIIQLGKFQNKPLYKLQYPSGEFLTDTHPRGFGYVRNWLSINEVIEFAKQENIQLSK